MDEARSREYHIDPEYRRLFAGAIRPAERGQRAGGLEFLHGDKWSINRFQQFSIKCKCKQHLSITAEQRRPTGATISSLLRHCSSRHLTKPTVHHPQQPQQQQTIVTLLTRLSVAGRRQQQCSKVKLRLLRPWTEPAAADRSQLERQSTAAAGKRRLQSKFKPKPAAVAFARKPTSERWQLRKRSAAV